jgi:hypothetical protein
VDSPEQYQGPVRRPFRDRTKPRVEEKILRTETVQVERKSITLNLQQNPRGSFLRIIEEANGHFNAVAIPASGLKEIAERLAKMLENIEPTPANEPPPGPSGISPKEPANPE